MSRRENFPIGLRIRVWLEECDWYAVLVSALLLIVLFVLLALVLQRARVDEACYQLGSDHWVIFRGQVYCALVSNGNSILVPLR